MKKVIAVEGMKCAGCAKAVKSKLEELEGVENVDVSLDTKSVFVETQRDLSVDELNDQLLDTSYQAVSVTNM